MLASQATLAVLALSSLALALNDSPELSRRSSLHRSQKQAAKKSSLSSVSAARSRRKAKSVSSARAHKASVSAAKAHQSAAPTLATSSSKKLSQNKAGCFPTAVAYAPVFDFRQSTEAGCVAFCKGEGEGDEFSFVGMDLFDQDGSRSDTPSCYCLDRSAKLTAPVDATKCGAEWGSSVRGFASVFAI